MNDGSIDLRPVSARYLGDDTIIVRDWARLTELQSLDQTVSELASPVDGGLLGVHQVDAIDASCGAAHV